MKNNIVVKCFMHTRLVIRHKWLVFKFCIKLGIPFRGLIHDLSKFSPEEFIESVKYYNGKESPINICIKENGVSNAWLHHFGRNKHHPQYWIDISKGGIAPVIPYKYAAEMICDKLSASIIYNGKNWTNASEYDYWLVEKNKSILNPKTENFLTAVFEQVKDNGIEKTINKKNIQSLYKKYCIDDKSQYIYNFKIEWEKIN